MREDTITDCTSTDCIVKSSEPEQKATKVDPELTMEVDYARDAKMDSSTVQLTSVM